MWKTDIYERNNEMSKRERDLMDWMNKVEADDAKRKDRERKRKDIYSSKPRCNESMKL